MTGLISPVVACLTTDRVVRGSNFTLAYREFLRAPEMNIQGSFQPCCEMVP